MRFSGLVTLAVLVGVTPTALAQEEAAAKKGFGLFLSLENRSYTEPTSIDSFIHEFDGDLEFGEYAFIYNNFEVGATYSNWSLSYVDRYDNFYTFSNDLAKFYYESENGLPQVVNQVYDLELEGSYLRAKGLKLGYDWQLSPGLTISAAGSYLKPSEFYDGSLRGNIELLPNDTYSGQLNMGLLSYKDVILDYPLDEDADGNGYSIDLGFDWQINQQWGFGLEVRDAFSSIDWKGALNSEFNVTTATRSFDSDGQLSTTPTLSGKQFVSDVEQSLPEKLFSNLRYQISDKHGLAAEVFHTDYFTHATLAYQYSFATDHKLALSWGVDTQSLGIEYLTSFGRFGISADNLNYEDAHSVNIIFDLNFSL